MDKKMTWEEIVPKEIYTNEFCFHKATYDEIIEKLKQAESQGLIALNPPRLSELLEIVGQIYALPENQEKVLDANLGIGIARAIHQRIERGR